MVNSCSANGCKNKNTKGGTLTFHRFPLNNKHLLKLWLYQIKRGTWEPSKYSVICSEHFTKDSFVFKGPQNSRRTLKNDAYPTIFSIENYTQVPKKKKNPREKGSTDVEMSEEKEEGEEESKHEESSEAKADEEESTSKSTEEENSEKLPENDE